MESITTEITIEVPDKLMDECLRDWELENNQENIRRIFNLICEAIEGGHIADGISFKIKRPE